VAIYELGKLGLMKIQNCKIESVTANAFRHSIVQRPLRAADAGGDPVQQMSNDLLIADAISRMTAVLPTDR